MHLKPWHKLLFGGMLSSFFLWLALRGIDWAGVGTLLGQVRWEYSPLILVVWSLSLGVRAVRWYILLGRQVPMRPLFHVHNIGFLLNNVLPFRAGELARAYLISRTEAKVSGWAVLSTIVTERILDVLSLTLLLVLVLLVLPLDAVVVGGGLMLGAVAVIGFALLVLFAHRRAWAHRLLNFSPRLQPVLVRLNLAALLDRLLDGLQPLTTRRGLQGALLWSVLAWGFGILEVWVLALFFPDWPTTPEVGAALVLALVTASLSIVVPFTVAGVGPFEAATIFALRLGGISQEAAVTFAVVWHVGIVLNYAFWGALGLLALGLSPGQVQVRRGAAAVEKEEGVSSQETAT